MKLKLLWKILTNSHQKSPKEDLAGGGGGGGGGLNQEK